METEKAYNLWASRYDLNHNKTRDLDALATVKTLEKYSFSHVIELGCGTGKNTGYLLTKANHVTAIDLSAEMLDRARAKITDPRVHFLKADLQEDWRIGDHTANLVTCSLVLEHIEELDPVFTRVEQKLQPNGYFFICELHPARQYSGSRANFETANGNVKPDAYVHHLSDYLRAARRNNLKLVELEEWFDEPDRQTLPRLISFVFRNPGK